LENDHELPYVVDIMECGCGAIVVNSSASRAWLNIILVCTTH